MNTSSWRLDVYLFLSAKLNHLCVYTDVVYGELGYSCKYVRYFIIIKHWVQITHTNENKLKYDFESPDTKTMMSRVYGLLCIVHLVLMMHVYFKISVIGFFVFVKAIKRPVCVMEDSKNQVQTCFILRIATLFWYNNHYTVQI